MFTLIYGTKHVEIKIGNFKLIYNDPRRFGYFSYFKNDEEISDSFRKYGPEPFDPLFNKNYIIIKNNRFRVIKKKNKKALKKFRTLFE